MKKIINIIITLSIFFSSMDYTFAEEWYLEKLLDLNYWVEEHNIELAKMDNVNFNNPEFNKVYNELQNIDRVLKDEFIKKYRNWEYTYYQVNWIVTNYKNFVYHANKFFYMLKIEENNPNYDEMGKAILNSYTNMRSSFKKVKNIVKKSY